MPKYTPVEFPPGMVRGATSRTTPGRWYDGSLVRWREGVLTPIGGWERIEVELLSSTARTIYGWVASNEARQIAIGCDAGFYSLWETRLLDITPDDFIPDETTSAVGGYGTWDYGVDEYGTGRKEGTPADFLVPNVISLDNFGTLLLAMSETDGRLLVYDPRVAPQQKLKPVKAAAGKPPVPLGNRAMLVSPERFVIIIGADGNPRRVAWSSREDYTDWNFASVTNTAGYLDLDAASGLIALKSVKNATLLFSSSEVWQMRYLGNDLVHGVEKIQENTSLISPYSVATFNGKAMWWNRTGFSMYDSGYIKPVPCDVMDFLISDVDPAWERLRTHAVVNNVFSEITWFYVAKDKNVVPPGATPPAVFGEMNALDRPDYFDASISVATEDGEPQEPYEPPVILPRVKQTGSLLNADGFFALSEPLEIDNWMVAVMVKDRETYPDPHPALGDNPHVPFPGWTVVATSEPHEYLATTVAVRKVTQEYFDEISTHSIEAFRRGQGIKNRWAFYGWEIRAAEGEAWEDICSDLLVSIKEGTYFPPKLTVDVEANPDDTYLTGTVARPYDSSINVGNDGSTSVYYQNAVGFVNLKLVETIGTLAPGILVSGEMFSHVAMVLKPMGPGPGPAGFMNVIEDRDTFSGSGEATVPETNPALSGSGIPDSYVTFNFEEGWWSIGRLSRTAGIPVLVNHDPIMAGPNGELYRHEVPGKTAYSSEGASRIWAKSGAADPGAEGAMVTVNGLIPDAESGFGSTRFSFHGRLTPEGEEKTHGPYQPGTNGYLACRFTARSIEIEVEQAKDGRWTLGKPGFDIKTRGQR